MKEITLDGEVYILKSDLKKTKKKEFDFAKQVKLFYAFKRLDFKLSDEEIEEPKELWIKEPAYVWMIGAKTDEAKNFLMKFATKDNLVEMDFEKWWDKGWNGDKGERTYSMDYLEKSINILKISSEAIKIITKEVEYPILLENQHFRIVFAPRINTDSNDEDKIWGSTK